MSNEFDGELFGQEIVAAVRAFVDKRCTALETKIALLETKLEQRNFSYQGTWKEGKIYSPGQFATYSGAIWHSNVFHNTAKPGDGETSWTLACKAGRDGKDAR